MSGDRLSISQVFHISIKRLYAGLGWPGCMGGVLLLVSALGLAWLHQASISGLQWHQQAMQRAVVASSALPAVPTLAVLQSAPPALPHEAESVEIIKRIKSVVQASDLMWPQADYRFLPASEDALASIEIRTTIKGPYPKLREVISKLLNREPALALRELSLSRPNGDALEVEAKMRWVVFLADGWTSMDAGGAR